VAAPDTTPDAPLTFTHRETLTVLCGLARERLPVFCTRSIVPSSVGLSAVMGAHLVGAAPVVVGDVAGEDLNAGAGFGGDKGVGALLAGEVGAVADEESEAGVRLAFEEFAHQLHAEEAGGSGEQDQFVVVHAGTGLSARTQAKAVEQGPFVGWARGIYG